jgi:hypothetical protein
MSDEEYAAFKNKVGRNYYCHHHGYGHKDQSTNESK